jgi:hypothetical protein
VGVGDGKARPRTGHPRHVWRVTQPEEGTASMVWRVKSIIHRTTPAHEREQICATEADFGRAVKYALAWTRLISATLPDGTVLDESALRRRYGGPKD